MRESPKRRRELNRSVTARLGLKNRPKSARGVGGSVTRLAFEQLESRTLLSATIIDTQPLFQPDLKFYSPLGNNAAATGTTSPVYITSPSAMRGAYGLGQYTASNDTVTGGIEFNGVAGDGRGQTIAIVDAYSDPNALSDLNAFSTAFGLPTFGGSGPAFTVLNQNGTVVGGHTTVPTEPSGESWVEEESLDIEWAHVMAPLANIDLFEANNAGSNLYTAVASATKTTGVVVVSMSWSAADSSSDSSDDSKYFVTPTGHLGGAATIGGTNIAGGITFFAAAGDDGIYAANSTTVTSQYPADSPNVVAVGGTSLSVSGTTWSSETVWGNGTSSGTSGGGGGGISTYESQPGYQMNIVNAFSTTKRTYPDISVEANPSQGVAIYDSTDFGASTPWCYGYIGGTSLASPMMAAMVAIADQGRASVGVGSLYGSTQTLPEIYALGSSSTYGSDFHDITSGSNGDSAGTGYDLASGLGSPIANELLPALAGSEQLAFGQGPSNAVFGTAISPSITVKVEDAAGNVVTSDSSTVTIAIANNAGGGTLGGTLTATAVNGVATFSNLSINAVGTGYTLTATDASLVAATSAAFNITPPAPPTVATAAAAAPSTVTATTTNLTVLGADTKGESTLTYTWSATTLPQGATAPTFSANGTNAAKSTTATFTSSGTYGFTVNIADPYGQTVASMITVTVAQILSSIEVSPQTVNLGSAGSEQFTATGYDQFSHVMTAQPVYSWTSTAGTISASGLFTAPYATSTTTVVASSGTLAGVATVNATNNAPTVAKAASALANPLQSVSLSVLGADDTGQSLLTYTWAATTVPQGATAPTFSVNGSNAAQNTTATLYDAGNYVFTATITDAGGLTATSSVSVTVGQTFTSIALTPGAVSLGSGARQQFHATGLDQFGNALASQPTFDWTLVSGLGLLSLNGWYTASVATGTTTVEASADGLTQTASVVVADAVPTVATAAAASSSTVTTTSTTLSVLGADTEGGGESNLSYTWTATGPGPVSFGGNGSNHAKTTVATFTQAGNYNFVVTIADQGGLSTTSSVSVTVNLVLTNIVVVPAATGLNANGSQTYVATAVDQFDVPLATQPAFTWSVVGGGSIDSSGNYTSSPSASSATIEASSGDVIGSYETLAGYVQWNTGTNVSWNDPSVWTSSSSGQSAAAPGLTGTQQASVVVNSAEAGVLSLNGVSPDVANIAFDSAAGDQIAQGTGGTLQLDNGAASATVTVAVGSQTVMAPVALVSNVNVGMAVGSQLTLSGGVTGIGQSLTLSGPGILTLNGVDTFTGGTTVNSGTLVLDGAHSLASGSTLVIGSTSAVSSVVSAPAAVSASIVAPASVATTSASAASTANVRATVVDNRSRDAGITWPRAASQASSITGPDLNLARVAAPQLTHGLQVKAPPIAVKTSAAATRARDIALQSPAFAHKVAEACVFSPIALPAMESAWLSPSSAAQGNAVSWNFANAPAALARLLAEMYDQAR